MKFGFIGGAYQSISPNIDAQECTNLFPEATESGSGKTPAALIGTPGKHVFANLPTQPVRGLWAGEQRLFVVAGSKLYEVDSGGNPINGLGGNAWRGDVGDDAAHSPVEMFPNGNQLFIVSAGRAYCDSGLGPVAVDYASSLAYTDLAIDGVDNTKITSAANPFSAGDVGLYIDVTGGAGFTVQRIQIVSVAGNVATANVAVGVTGSTGGTGNLTQGPLLATQGAFLDGYFIAMTGEVPGDVLSNKKFVISELYDGTAFDPLENAIKEGYPDALAAILADHEELWLFGTQTTEVHRNEGDPDFPFRRDPSGFIHQGCGAPWSRTRLKHGVAWLGTDTRGGVTAWRAQGFQPVRISTHALENIWRGYATVADAIGWTYVEAGHEFWMLTFPTANATWCYDAATGIWHRRGWWNGAALQRDRARCHCFVFGKHLVGDWENGKIYHQSLGFYDDFGGEIYRRRVAPAISEEEEKIFHHRLQLDLETGQGAMTATLDHSDDHGHTYSTPRAASVEDGQYRTRLMWRRLGAARDRRYGVTIVGQRKIAIVEALLRATKGVH